MRTKLLVAAGLSLAASTAAYADSGDGPAANTLFTEWPGVVAQADVPNASAYAQNRQVQPQEAQSGQAVHVYATQPSRRTWLFQANPNQGANS
jgi:hypothetical protein